MNNEQLDNNLAETVVGKPTRPKFLKTVCILSFISSGFWISLFGAGISLLNVNEDELRQVWDQAMEKKKNADILNGIDPIHLFHEIGMLSVYGTLINLMCLIGVMMMWRLNKIGFFVYIAAELAGKFIGYFVDLGSEIKGSSGQIIFFIVLDLVFIGMYAANLKFMSNKNELPV